MSVTFNKILISIPNYVNIRLFPKKRVIAIFTTVHSNKLLAWNEILHQATAKLKQRNVDALNKYL